MLSATSVMLHMGWLGELIVPLRAEVSPVKNNS